MAIETLLISPPPVVFGDTGNIDAFSRLRVSEVETLFDSQQEYGLPVYSWNSVTANGGAVAHQSARSSSFLNTTTASGSRALIQSRTYFRYQPGKSQFVLLTGVFGNVSTNNVHRAGQFDDANGVFLQITSAGPSLVRRTSTSGSVVDNTVLQAAWNVDPMNGSGPSGVTLDFSKTQILVIDYQWLGVGRIRVGFDVDGVLYYVHYFKHANILSVVYSQTPNLPIRYENLNTGAAAAGSTLEAICSSVMSEGGFQNDSGVTRSSSTAITTYSVSTTLVPILCIRPALLFGGKTNRARIIIESLEVSASAGARWVLNYYGAPTGARSFSLPTLRWRRTERTLPGQSGVRGSLEGSTCSRVIWVPVEVLAVSLSGVPRPSICLSGWISLERHRITSASVSKV